MTLFSYIVRIAFADRPHCGLWAIAWTLGGAIVVVAAIAAGLALEPGR